MTSERYVSGFGCVGPADTHGSLACRILQVWFSVRFALRAAPSIAMISHSRRSI